MVELANITLPEYTKKDDDWFEFIEGEDMGV